MTAAERSGCVAVTLGACPHWLLDDGRLPRDPGGDPDRMTALTCRSRVTSFNAPQRDDDSDHPNHKLERMGGI